MLVVSGLVAGELAGQIERRRRRFSDTPHVNFSSVWTLAAALLLPLDLVSLVAVVLYAHLWVRSWRGVTGVRAYRVVFSVANVIVSCQVAQWFARELGLFPLGSELALTGVLALAVVVLAYFATNSIIVGIAIALLHPGRSLAGLTGPASENVLELATLCFGTVAAVLVSTEPWLVGLLVLPLYALHRSVLVTQLERAATRDGKTGLLNAASWRAQADAELDRARRHDRAVGLLMIDIDRFRTINERYDRGIGDEVLGAVGATLRKGTRQEDLCGRLGGEEFVIMLPGVAGQDLVRVADRLRRRIAETTIATGAPLPLQVSVSMGAASYPRAGSSVEELLLAADNGLFAAKDGGRNRVVLAG
ncbi:GGDEF domain-containing protein [Prauserella flavalba]|uniref:GGDEF domain-containing protein n=1 Tax=Prauserella flavalba TaxID=1477506 RepID=UPI00143DCA09|nr:GGDEF domain-containing protein [Prauserella flavalba]